MLVECLEIRDGLRAAKIHYVPRHPQIMFLGRADLLRVFLGSQGSVDRVAILRAEDAQHHWTLRHGKHSSFPRLALHDKTKKGKDRLRAPLRPGGDPDSLRQLASRQPLAEKLKAFWRLCDSTRPALSRLVPGRSHYDHIKEWWNLIQASASQSMRALFEGVLGRSAEQLLAEIDQRIREQLEQSPEERLLELASRLLFLDGGALLLDSWVEGDVRPACHPQNVETLTRALTATVGSAPSTGKCGLTGDDGILHAGPFPVVTLPVVGESALFAKYPGESDAEGEHADGPRNCVFRYGHAWSRGMPVNADLVLGLRAALEELVDRSREGKTWSRLPCERPRRDPLSGKSRAAFDLLLAFVPSVPDLPLADSLAGNPGSAAVAPGQFERLAQDLVKMSKGRAVAYGQSCQFIVIRKLDPGNCKAIFTTTSSLTQLASAAERWTDGCNNVPRDLISLPVALTKGGSRRRLAPWVIAPGSIVALGGEVFTHGGSKRSLASGPPFADAMRLFLGGDAIRTQSAARLLPVFLARRGPVVTGIAHVMHRGDMKGFDARAALETVSVLGLLLAEHSRGRKKEVYMNDGAFLLGQLLAGADILHRGYCEHQRGGSIPLSLLGNQILAVAQRSPIAALSMLGNRWRVYAGWAEKHRYVIPRPADDGSSTDWAAYRAVRLAHRLAPLASSLHQCLADRADDVFRAELLLGYLAGLPGAAKPSESTKTDDRHNNDQMED